MILFLCVDIGKEKVDIEKVRSAFPYSFPCLRAKSAADGNDGKRGWGRKKGIGLPNIHVADVMGSAIARSYFCAQRISLALLQCKGSPAPVDLLWCWGGAITLHMCNINFNPCTPEGAPV